MDLRDAPSLIERQFPVSRLSKESYKERKAGASQTLTGLGKWWGRKPLVLVRATILASLLPATDKPETDRELFLRLMRMDDDGVFDRQKDAPMRPADVAEAFVDDPARLDHWISVSDKGKPAWNPARTEAEIEALRKAEFAKLPLDERLKDALRPEEVDDRPYQEDLWKKIEGHWGVKASSLDTLVEELGKARFGHRPKVGDCFCGGGSIPFEAARIGCEAFASDLNPVAGLLTWGTLNIVGGGKEAKEKVEAAQKEWLEKVDRQITEWGIEHNAAGERADAYLYCAETRCPNTECGWSVPMSPSWLVSQKSDLGVRLVPDEASQTFNFEMASGSSISAPTVAKGKLVCPHCKAETPVKTIRGDHSVGSGKNKETRNRLRQWEKADFKPRPGDIFQERLYCVRWTGGPDGKRRYAAPTREDLDREAMVEKLLSERFADWQEKGFIPSMRIEPGDKTDEPIRTRGWTHWNHLFNPRQLLVLGLVSITGQFDIATALTLGKMLDWNSRLVIWNQHRDIGQNTFMNQALNTLLNYCCRSYGGLKTLTKFSIFCAVNGKREVDVSNASQITFKTDIWITDPPYADAVNYHELTEFFLAWYQPHLKKHFPDWPIDSRRALAVKGSDQSFMKSMVDVYRNLTEHMPDNGLQVMMFTHQDAKVWADLAVIIWASGLRVTSAWVIGTETTSGLKEGNYVQGTVLLVLRKRNSDEEAYRSDVWPAIRKEVKEQVQFMRGLDAGRADFPDFSDSDYQLAAYAAALKAVTGFAAYNGKTPDEALEGDGAARDSIRKLIDDALHLAGELLIPIRLHADDAKRNELWGRLDKSERFLIQSIEAARSGARQQGVFQDLAKGFGLAEYKDFLASAKANEVRFKTPTEWGRKGLETGAAGFSGSLCRALFRAIHETGSSDDSAQAGLAWLKTELGAEFQQRKETVVALLEYFSGIALPEWTKDAESAGLLAEAVKVAGF